jgi:hypothetical protein
MVQPPLRSPFPTHRNALLVTFLDGTNCGALDLEIITANDKIYWGNGHYDRSLWDGETLTKPLGLVDPASVVVVGQDATRWAEFVEAEIFEVLVHFETQSYFLTPW